MRYDREGRTPNDDFVNRFSALVDEELRIAEQDELVAKNRKKPTLMDDVQVNAAKAQQVPDQPPKKGKGKGSPKGDKPPKGDKEKPCNFFMKHGRCRFGDDCIFSHDVSKFPPKKT